MSTFAMGGLLAGLAFAAIDWLILLPLVMRPMRAQLDTLIEPERSSAEGRLNVLRWLFLAQFVVFPVVGYILGGFLDRAA